MPGLRLRGKILLYSSALLVSLIAAMLAFVSWRADRFVSERIAADLEQGRERVALAERERLARLELVAQALASFPDLKAALATDTSTIRDFLQEQQQSGSSDLLLVTNPAGQVLARTDSPEPLPLPGGERWMRPALEQRTATGVLRAGSGVYHAAMVPAHAAGTVFGFVLAGARIDDAFARNLAGISQGEVVLVGEGVLATTLPEAHLRWRSREDWMAALGGARSPGEVEIAGEHYAAMLQSLGPEGELGAVMLKSRDRALAPYRGIQLGLAALGLVVALAGIFASAFLARSVTAPVSRLVEATQAVAAGNFDLRLADTAQDEIGDLARSFNSMVQGLRERDNMRRFVSRSTLEMIQASLHRDVSAGERVELTVFFSDMRGFTSFSERRPPEDVMRVLNECFALQAECVKKFQGDIDKYMGDSVVAIFSGEDMALNAVACGLGIQKAMRAHNASHSGVEHLEVGIGIVTGEVVLGSIGSQDRQDFTVIGSAVNLCARLCAQAGPQQVLISESTFQRVQHMVQVERLEPVVVKGFREPVPVYRVAGYPL